MNLISYGQLVRLSENTSSGKELKKDHLGKIAIDKNRINKLIEIVLGHEPRLSKYLNSSVHYFSLNDIKQSLISGQHNQHAFQAQIKEYFELDSAKRLVVSDKFMDMIKSLNQQSVNEDVRVEQEKLVFVSAGNAEFFNTLKHSLNLKKQFFPHNKMIVYDLGMDSDMVKELIEMCNCELRRFRLDKYPPHFHNLQTYSWKPTIIQEVLSEVGANELILYMDSSIKFITNNTGQVIKKASTYGMAIRYLDLAIPCYTDRRMFEWFGEQPEQYSHVYTFEANLIVLRKDFLTSFVVSVWAICALDRGCIAPRGAHIHGGFLNWIRGCQVCGCHRFDQDALTIIYTYFFEFLPKFVMMGQEMHFYDIKRRFYVN